MILDGQAAEHDPGSFSLVCGASSSLLLSIFGRSAVWIFVSRKVQVFMLRAVLVEIFTKVSPANTAVYDVQSSQDLEDISLSCIESWKEQRYWSKKSDGMLPPKKRAPTTSHAFVHCNPHFSLTPFWHHLGCYLQGYLAGVAVPALVQLRDQFGNNRTSSSPNLLFQVWQSVTQPTPKQILEEIVGSFTCVKSYS